MGRTIPSFRIAAVLEEEEWKLFRKYLRNKNEKEIIYTYVLYSKFVLFYNMFDS